MPPVPPAADKRAVWETKPALRAIYGDYFRRLREHLVPGRMLEIGAGGAFLAETTPGTIAMDIRPASWLDVVGDALALPFGDASLENIAMVDVLHHLTHPGRFFGEAARVLRPGGRLLMIEPAITPLSSVFYRLFHAEPVDLKVDPFDETPLSSDDPDDANQAIPTLLFVRHRHTFERIFADFSLCRIDHLSLWGYPLSGGFQRWCLLPTALMRPLLRIEDRLLPHVGRLAAFRLLVVAERRGC